MEDQLKLIETNLQEDVRNTCGKLVQRIGVELRTLQEHAARLQDYDILNQCMAESSCTIQEHTYKLHDYEELQEQHRVTLESCELLRSQNIRLQNQIKDLLAKQKSSEVYLEPPPTCRPCDHASRQAAPDKISSTAKKLIQDHPELQAILHSQVLDYTKLQNAHSVLLNKLKEHQEIITQIRNNDIEVTTDNREDAAHLAYLRNIIGSTHTSGRLPATSTPTSSAGSRSSRNQSSVSGIKQNGGGPEHIVIEEDVITRIPSLSPNHSNIHGNVGLSKEPPKIAVLGSSGFNPSIIHSIPLSDSQPEFVFERPVKRRRLGNSGRIDYVSKLIKSESKITDHEVFDEGQASIDLDAIYTPILPIGRRSEEIRPRNSSDAIADVNSSTTQRYPEPPRKPPNNPIMRCPTSITAIPSVEEVVLVKNEPNTANPTNAEDEFPSPPQPMISHGQAHLKDTTRRRILQPKTTNTPILNHSDKSVVQTVSSIKKENVPPNRMEGTAIAAQSDPPIVSASRDRSSRKTVAEFKTASAITKYQTALQKKRDKEIQKSRDKSVNELSINDFKLNPAMNQGFNQTFGISNPSHESNKCPMDCSMAGCCGAAFAAAIKSSGIASLEDMSTSKKDRLIQTYLGFPISRLGVVSRQAYQKLLGEAIGKQFAEKYGKYHQPRANSPPGYWRVEFPSTQERAIDGGRADNVERATIQKRRKEALKGEGLWVFVNE